MDGSSKFIQFMFASHELNHARLFTKLVQRHGPERAEEIWRLETNTLKAYAREEVLVQRAAEFQMRMEFKDGLDVMHLEDYADALRISAQIIDRFKWEM